MPPNPLLPPVPRSARIFGGRKSSPYGLALVVSAAGLLGVSSGGWAQEIVGWGESANGRRTFPARGDFVTIDAGQSHSLALTTSGSVIGVGLNSSGQLGIPGGATGFTAVTAGVWNSLALRADGTVGAWGGSPPSTVPAGLSGAISISTQIGSVALMRNGTAVAWDTTDFSTEGLDSLTAVSAGVEHMLALRSDGTVVARGSNQYGQSNVPAGLVDVVAIAAGHRHSLALKRDGTVVAWGAPGEVGAPPAGLTNVVALSAWTHSLALKADGTVVGWGWDAFGQATVPAGLTGVVAISAGDRHSLALRSSGAAAAPRLLGPAEIRGDAGVPGFYHRIVAANGPVSFEVTGLPDGLVLDPQTGIISGQPMQTGTFPLTLSAHNANGTGSRMMTLTIGGEPFVTAPLKNQYILGAAATGTLKVYGNPVITATGLPPGLSLSPDGVLSGTPQLAGNFSASLTLTNSWGTRVEAWQVEITPVMTWAPVHDTLLPGPPGLSTATNVAAGPQFFARLENGAVVAWPSSTHPAPTDLTDVDTLAGSPETGLALHRDGSLTAWGAPVANFGQIPPAGLSGFVGIAAGAYNSVALREDGTVAVWGLSTLTDAAKIAALSDVVAVAAGEKHCAALRSDGTVVSWGDSSRQQLGTATSAVAIAAGSWHTTVLKSNGTVTVIGDNTYGQRLVPGGLTNVVAITAGETHSAALKQDGSVVVWGMVTGPKKPPVSGIAALASTTGELVFLAGSPAAAPRIISSGLARGDASGGSVYYRIAATGNPSKYTASGLPAGVTVNASTGVISGTPTETGTFNVLLGAENASGSTSKSLTLTVGGQPRFLPDPNQYPVLVGQELTLPGRFAGKPTVTAEGLPPGMSLTATGVLTGTPSEPGEYSITLHMTNAVGTADAEWNLEVTPLRAWGWPSWLDPLPPGFPRGIGRAMQVSQSSTHGLVLRADGTVVTWSDGQNGSPAPVPPGLADVVAVSAASGYSLALKRDGTVTGWGGNFVPPPAGLAGVMAIAVGGGHALALKRDGTVTAWGGSTNAVTTVPAGLNRVVAIAAGPNWSAALKSDGTVSAWGDNTRGQTSVPVDLTDAVAIAAGHRHALALRRDGRVVAWGENLSGEATVPATLTNGMLLAAGDSRSAAITTAGRLSLWGANFGDRPPLGLTDLYAIACAGAPMSVLRGSPQAAPFLTSPPVVRSDAAGIGSTWFRLMAANAPTSFAVVGLPPGLSLDAAPGVVSGDCTQPGTYNLEVTASNAAGSGTSTIILEMGGFPRLFGIPPDVQYALGSAVSLDLNAYGSPTITTTGLPPGLAVSPQGLLTGTPAVPGLYHVVFDLTNAYGQTRQEWNIEVTPVFTWGKATQGLGTIPSGLGDVTGLAGSFGMSLALHRDGTITQWGAVPPSSTPMPAAAEPAVAIAASSNQFSALTPSGAVHDWGSDSSSFTVPRPDVADAIALSCGQTFRCALRRDGTVVGWGNNSYGQSEGPGVGELTAVAAGAAHGVALRSDGTVVAWGRNTNGQTTVPAGLSGVVAVAAGGDNSYALKGDGTVVAWGSNSSGQRTVPAGLTGVVALAAGYSHVLALKVDGTVVAWGENSQGQRQVPAGLREVAVIAAGDTHSLALRGMPGIAPVIVTAPSARTDTGRALWWRIAALNAPTQFSAVGLPAGVTIDPASGVITGVPAQPGIFPFSVTATNGAGSETRPFTLHVGGKPTLAKPASLFTLGYPATGTVPLGGAPTVSADGLPPGLVVSSTGVISGVPTSAGQYATSLRLTNAWGTTDAVWIVEVTPVVGWGSNAQGETMIPRGTFDAVSVATTDTDSLVLKADGTIVSFGRSGTPVPSSALSEVTAIAGGLDHFLALRADGTVAGWGNGRAGEEIVPQDLIQVKAIAAAGIRSMALKTDGTIVSWGGSLSVPAPDGLTGIIGIAAGDRHSLAIRADGSVAAWGDNNLGQSTPPAGLQDVVSVAAGRSHSLALRSDGTVINWGQVPGGLRPPAGVRAVAISAGGNRSHLVTPDLKVRTWGPTAANETAVPPGLTDVVASVAGATHSLAIRNPLPQHLPASAIAGQPYRLELSILRGATASDLPDGLSLNQTTGVISGSPLLPGFHPIAVTRYFGPVIAAGGTVDLTVIPDSAAARTAWQAWVSAHWPGAAGDIAPEADEDSDGATNLLEFALGGDPLRGGGAPGPLPPAERAPSLQLEIDVTETAARSLKMTGEFSADLHFSDPSTAPGTPVAGAPPGFVRYRFTDNGAGSPHRFGRVRFQAAWPQP